MRRSPGFTLIEVTVGLVLAGVVALLAYGALATATDTRDRLDEGLTAIQTEVAWRALMGEAIRSIRSSQDYGSATLAIVDGVDEEGRPADRLALITGASTPPLNFGADWRVSFLVASGGLAAEAQAVGRGIPPRLLRGPKGIVGMDVQALNANGSWADAWTRDQLPFAVRITFWTEQGPVAPAMVVAIPALPGL